MKSYGKISSTDIKSTINSKIGMMKESYEAILSLVPLHNVVCLDDSTRHQTATRFSHKIERITLKLRINVKWILNLLPTEFLSFIKVYLLLKYR